MSEHKARASLTTEELAWLTDKDWLDFRDGKINEIGLMLQSHWNRMDAHRADVTADRDPWLDSPLTKDESDARESADICSGEDW